MVGESEYNLFQELHRPQLLASGVPELFWPTLHEKIVNETFDVGKVGSLMAIEYEHEPNGYDPPFTVTVLSPLSCTDEKQIYLIDHAWTFRAEEALKHLREVVHLVERMAKIMGVHDEGRSKDDLIEKVYQRMWKYCNFYQVQNATTLEDRLPIWYVMDEIGSAVVHSNEPNVRVVPFIHLPHKMTYSLMFPIRDIEEGEIFMRDFVEGVVDERDVRILPWVCEILVDEPYIQIPPNDEYFLSGHIKESLPDWSKTVTFPKKPYYKVFTEYHLVKDFLTDDNFEIVELPEQADILWYTNHFRNFFELSQTPDKLVNQFPFEYIITIKDLLAAVCRRKNYGVNLDLETTPEWLPTTYNLKTELKQFVSYFQNRWAKGLENYWIIKPFNLARGLDTHITNNLDQIIRLETTGPKVAQKYISRPVLFFRPECCGGVKFDVRYVILLKSVKPLDVYVYRNFFLRFANRPFDLSDFDCYEQHFTVMNYTRGVSTKHMLPYEFREEWLKQNPDFPWANIENKIFTVLREVMECATMEDPPRGIAVSPQSRAMYAADIMLEWTDWGSIQPKLLEINWTPDCKRACKYFPEFYNDIFRLLFLDIKVDDQYFAKL